VESVELARRYEVGDLECAALGAPLQHAQRILAAERARRLDDPARCINERRLARGEEAVADEFPLVVADDLARNEPSKRLNDTLRKRLGTISGIRDVDQRKRVPHFSSAESWHDRKIRRTSYCHKRNDV